MDMNAYLTRRTGVSGEYCTAPLAPYAYRGVDVSCFSSSRASVKVVESTLMQRIRSLETQLREARAANSTGLLQTDLAAAGEQPPPYTSPDGSSTMPSVDDSRDGDRAVAEPPSSVVTKLMPSAIRFDMASGRVRYFGSTTHMNVLSRTGTANQRRDAHWPIALIVRDLSPDTHDYLMDLFWNLHNAVIHLIHTETFYRDQEHGGVEFYSTFLHLTMLATGFRYADKTRDDIRRLALQGYATSTLHEKAKALAKLEIDKPGGIPSIQAFQLLGGLEFCCGNDDTAWLFTGMCFRMVFDAGLHVDPSPLGLPERDMQIRHMVLWASMTTDRMWSLYLGRPITIKTSDVSPSCLSFDFGRMVLCQPSRQEKKLVTRIYEALLKMMEVVSQVGELRGPRPPKSTETYFKLGAIDQQLRDWQINLPEQLQWPQETHEDMPPPYYLLHTQYHAALILLHRPFVRYNENSEPDINNHFSSLSRSTCAESAKIIAVIFEQYRSRFDLAQVYGSAVQHAGTSATALMGEIILQSEPQERSQLIQKLASLRLSISHMSRNYQPAGHMTSVVDQFIRSVHNGNQQVSAQQQQQQQVQSQGQSNGESSSAGAGANEHVDFNPSSDFEGLQQLQQPSRKRMRVDAQFSFTPTCPGALSPSGLPFLPSSFLEGLAGDDAMFPDLAGMTDPSFQWDYPGALQ
uniref:Regulatory protein CefR n=1 Tax=Hapsidospora chrysogena TaxID=5044 RepID=G0WKS3_HAPCH|nr:regulatory protein CefR [Hapsidospora chrysogena]